jgi:hypothetical protein
MVWKHSICTSEYFHVAAKETQTKGWHASMAGIAFKQAVVYN